MTKPLPTQRQINNRIDRLILEALLAGGGTVNKPAGWKPTDFLQGIFPKHQQEQTA